MSVLGQRQTPTSSNSSTAKKPEPKGKEVQIKDGESSNEESVSPTNRRSYGIKVNKPETYYRDRNSLDDWLTQLDTYFYFNKVLEDKKAIFAFTFIRGRAERWIKPQVRKFYNDEEDLTEIFSNYNNFKTEIRRVFGILNEESTAKRMIQ